MINITLYDGSIINVHSINGTYFITNDALPENFAELLSHIKISGEISISLDDENILISPPIPQGEYRGVKLVHVMQFDNGTGFTIRAMSPAEINDMQRDANIEYIAMMAGITL